MHYFHSGKIKNELEPSVPMDNRGYCYGDGLFETIRVIRGKVINLPAHLDRLEEGMRTLYMKPGEDWDREMLKEKIDELLRLNGIKKGGVVKIHVDRKSGGRFYPENRETDILISAKPFADDLFHLNDQGWEVDIFRDIRLPSSPFSRYKTKNCLLNVVAAIRAKEAGLDDYLIVNEKDRIVEGSYSNLFLVSNGVLYTPALGEGCVAGTMRMQVINMALERGIKVYECELSPQNLLVSDEMFMTNALRGIVWVKGYQSKRYYHNMASQLVSWLNKKWTQEGA